MGKRGPAPEPSILKYIRGNPSKETLNTAEPTPELVPQDFPPPKILNGKAADVWNDTVPKLAKMRVLTEADVPTLTRYCIESALYLVCYEKVKTAGEEYIHWEPDPIAPTASCESNTPRSHRGRHRCTGTTPRCCGLSKSSA
jgi:phage terminase small subunit